MSDFVMEFVDELPPATRKGRKSAYDEVVATLRENPEQWVVVLRDESRPKVSGAQRTLKTRYEGIEAVTRTDGDEVVLFARSI